MRLMFVYWAFEDQGSGLLIQGYSRAARALGHEVAVYGRPDPKIPLNYSLDVGSADAVVFIFEWTTRLRQGDALDLARLVSRVPRRRRVILDGDGNYNDLVRVGADYNHKGEEERRAWEEVCDSLTDKVCQPTLHPLRPNVRTFLFYCYDPGWEVPLGSRAKDYAMLYVGHSKFRWGPMARVLRAVEPARDRLGRLGVVGHGWDAPPPWAGPMQMGDAYYTDVEYLKRLGVELLPPVPFGQVVAWMSKATFNPVISRPTFNRMRLVTPRFFETPAADTVPLFGLDEAYVAEIYGEAALELVLPAEGGDAKVLDLLRRPDHYAGVVRGVRDHLARKHSQAARLAELVEIIES
jgi:hypothetical protein